MWEINLIVTSNLNDLRRHKKGHRIWLFPSFCKAAEEWIFLDGETSAEGSYTSQFRVGAGATKMGHLPWIGSDDEGIYAAGNRPKTEVVGWNCSALLPAQGCWRTGVQENATGSRTCKGVTGPYVVFAETTDNIVDTYCHFLVIILICYFICFLNLGLQEELQ